MNQQEISFYEELQCNAFPALQNVMYDGWSVRFGGGFTYRVNCANAMYPEALPARDKVQYVESLYRQSGLSMKDAVKQVSKDAGIPRNTLYDAALQASRSE